MERTHILINEVSELEVIETLPINVKIGISSICCDMSIEKRYLNKDYQVSIVHDGSKVCVATYKIIGDWCILMFLDSTGNGLGKYFLNTLLPRLVGNSKGIYLTFTDIELASYYKNQGFEIFDKVAIRFGTNESLVIDEEFNRCLGRMNKDELNKIYKDIR